MARPVAKSPHPPPEGGGLTGLTRSGSVRIADWQGNELISVSVNKLKKLQNRDSIIWEVS
mgnify:CR=1 FL=1